MKKYCGFSDIKLISLDVDGVLTDGKLVWSRNGLEQLNFNVKDGTAIKELIRHGYIVCIITSNSSEIIKNRMKSLGIQHVFTGVADKLDVLNALTNELSIDKKDTMHVADDRNDIEILSNVGFSCCPSDSINLVKRICDRVLKTAGGEGVCVELLEMLDIQMS